MRRLAALVLAAAASGCIDTATESYIAPSVHILEPRVREAAEALNGWAGADVFSVRMHDSEEMVDGASTMRAMHDAAPTAGGTTTRHAKGVSILLPVDTLTVAIAHEMMHAAGFGHVNDPGNLMYGGMLCDGASTAAGCNAWEWELNADQVFALQLMAR